MDAYVAELLRPFSLPPDITTLPTVSLSERSQLPDEAAVYFVLTADRAVMYIGHTRSLRSRWRYHPHLERFLAREGMRLAWMPIADLHDGRLVEAYLIHHFDPPCNVMRDRLFSRRYTGPSVTLSREERDLLKDFAGKLSAEAFDFPYSESDALRIAALRYLRDSRFLK